MPAEFQAIYNAQLKQVDGQVMMTLKKEQDNLYSYETITRPCLLYTSPSPRDRG